MYVCTHTCCVCPQQVSANHRTATYYQHEYVGANHLSMGVHRGRGMPKLFLSKLRPRSNLDSRRVPYQYVELLRTGAGLSSKFAAQARPCNLFWRHGDRPCCFVEARGHTCIFYGREHSHACKRLQRRPRAVKIIAGVPPCVKNNCKDDPSASNKLAGTSRRPQLETSACAPPRKKRCKPIPARGKFPDLRVPHRGRSFCFARVLGVIPPGERDA